MAYALFVILFFHVISFSKSLNYESTYSSFTNHRKLLEVKQNNSAKHNHNDTKDIKVISPLKEEESMAGTEAAVLIIVVIVVLSVIGMVVYFIRKFDQLNRTLPTYRYSSLKTEVNGTYGPDDKMESQVLVSVSTEEEDDFDDEEEDNLSPPTLLVKSQTVMPNKSTNGSVSHKGNSPSENASKSEETTMDSDDELLQ